MFRIAPSAPLLLSALLLSFPVAAAEAPLAPWRPFLDRVLSDHPRAAQAESGVAQAEAEAEVLAQPLYNPEIGYAGEYKRSPAGTDSVGDTSLKSVVEVALTTDFGVKQESRRQIGQRGIAVARADSAEARLALAGEALAGLARFQGALRQEALAARQEEAMLSFLRLAERLRKAGDSSAADLALARLALAETARVHADARIELAQAREMLRGLCDCEPSGIAALPDPLSPELLGSPAGDEARLDELPAVQAGRARIETARADLSLARDERVPDPTFRLGGGRDGSATLVTFGVSLPIPVLNSGSARVVSAGRGLASAEAAEMTARRAARTEIAATRAAATEAWQGWQAWRTQAAEPLDQQIGLLERLWVGREISATDYFVQLRETVRAAQQGAELWTRAWTTLADGLRAANRIDTVVGL